MSGPGSDPYYYRNKYGGSGGGGGDPYGGGGYGQAAPAGGYAQSPGGYGGAPASAHPGFVVMHAPMPEQPTGPGGLQELQAPEGYHATCPFCHEKNSNFEKAKRLNKHYAHYCPMLNRCKWCDKAIEVKMLDVHYMDNCKFLRDDNGKATLQRCPTCDVPCSKEDYEKHQRGENCAKRPPRPGAKWCLLCDQEISPDTDQAWRDHLIGAHACTGNPRRTMNGWGEDKPRYA